ncbi:hypothetical protein [Streptomyces sp. NBC_01262]|uniref:hypothetical protein n=1 Tax=Streptomyces sp. NBC_01262 TaxID=2903803 RepID=UPI002E325332|nr:hypothetical protein [Streptomyces sp. NBC_01262]
MTSLSEASEAVAPAAANALLDLPVLGTPASWLDKLLSDLGAPAAVNETVELALLAVCLYLLGRWLLGQVAPWLARVLIGPVVALVGGVRVALLLPDLAVARTARLAHARPPAVVYTYGHMVLDVSDRLQAAVRGGFPAVARLSRWSGKVALAAVIAAALFWNGTYCSGSGVGDGCTSPAQQWTTSVKTMFAKDAKDGDKPKTSTSKKDGKH